MVRWRKKGARRGKTINLSYLPRRRRSHPLRGGSRGKFDDQSMGTRQDELAAWNPVPRGWEQVFHGEDPIYLQAGRSEA